MKLTRTLGLVVLLGCSVGVARADGDSRGGVGTSGPGSPPCTSFSFTVNGSSQPNPGAIPANTDCEESFNAGTIEVIASGDYATDPLVLYSTLLQPLTVDRGSTSLSEVAANLLLLNTGVGASLEWSQTCGEYEGSTSLEECTLTAPTITTNSQRTVLATLQAAGLINDGDCDRDDDITFVPKTCDLVFTTGPIGNLPGDAPDQLFTPGSTINSVSSQLPEPGTVPLLLVGAAGLFVFRRKFAR